MTTPWFYPDKISATPGDTIRLFGSAQNSPCELSISRVGLSHVQVASIRDIALTDEPTPEDADANGCGWPEIAQFVVGDQWATGYYDLCLSASDGSKSHHFLCVRKAESAPKAKAVLILSTNTYFAYNYWGGSNSYAHVENLMAGKANPDESRLGAIGRLSSQRPFAQNLLASPSGVPRLINLTPRGINEKPVSGKPDFARNHGTSPYDGSAGFLRKWEHRFVEWAERNGIDFDYLTDQDLESHTDVLAGYKSTLMVGHSEYWSGKGRKKIDRFVDDGGNLAIFSGNTCYWKVRWEDDGTTMVAHKWRGELDDPLWQDPQTRPDATHLWSHEAFSAPEAKTIGLTFLYGGYHRICMCVARGSAAYTIYNELHWALEGSDLYYGDTIGGDLPLIGYENDGCLIKFGNDGLPVSDGGLGVPENLEIIAFAPATLAESERSPYPPLIPREQPDVLARIAYGESTEQTRNRLMRGHAVMASFKRGKGEVFNAGTTEWVHGLAENDFVEKITRNVLKRFNVI